MRTKKTLRPSPRPLMMKHTPTVVNTRVFHFLLLFLIYSPTNKQYNSKYSVWKFHCIYTICNSGYIFDYWGGIEGKVYWYALRSVISITI